MAIDRRSDRSFAARLGLGRRSSSSRDPSAQRRVDPADVRALQERVGARSARSARAFDRLRTRGGWSANRLPCRQPGRRLAGTGLAIIDERERVGGRRFRSTPSLRKAAVVFNPFAHSSLMFDRLDTRCASAAIRRSSSGLRLNLRADAGRSVRKPRRRLADLSDPNGRRGHPPYEGRPEEHDSRAFCGPREYRPTRTLAAAPSRDAARASVLPDARRLRQLADTSEPSTRRLEERMRPRRRVVPSLAYVRHARARSR